MPIRTQPCKRASLIGLALPPGRSGENTSAAETKGNETPATWWASSSARLESGTESMAGPVNVPPATGEYDAHGPAGR